jgi:uncharacterized protein with ParB-like and HNH nuclease domain
MNALRYSLKQLLTAHRDRKFVVPNYQREYEWETPGDGKGEVGQFWDDIWHNCWKTGRKHFLGAILVDDRGADSELVDGQQRVTTIFLLVLALRDLLKSRSLPVFNPERWLKCAPGTALRLVLQDGPCQDAALIRALYAETSSQLDPALLSESKIIRAYRYFKTELDSHLDGESDLTEFLDRTFDRVEVLLLSVEPDDRPAAIFETLNSRGRQVSPTDLVRNLFNYIRDADSKAVELARQVWSYVFKLFDEDELKQFLSIFVLRDGNQTPSGGLYEELRFEFVQAQAARELVAWIKGFERSARNYHRILEPAEDTSIDRLLLELKQLTVPSLAPLLLVVLDCIDDSDRLEQTLMTLCSLAVRIAVVYERPAAKFQQLMTEAGNCFDPMHKVNRGEALQKLEQLLREFWIPDDRFIDRFALRPLFGPGVHMRRLRYYLQELETFYSANTSSDLRFNSDNSSIDHVMPDSLSETWQRDLGEKNVDQLHLQHESLVDTIGNLTVVLIPDSSKIKNLAFSEKKQVYLNPEETLPKLGLRRRHPVPACALNEYFRNHDKWGFAEILERGRALAAVAASIWRVGIDIQ